MRVDLGCGGNKREGYTGVDLIEGPGIDICCDVLNGLPFENGEVEELHTSHFLEHIPKQKVRPLLKECHRVVKEDGKITVVVPDLIWVLEKFLSLPEREKWGFPVDTIFGNQLHEGEFHKTGFSKWLLKALLEEAGFKVNVCMPVWSHSQQSLLARGRK
jgi:predicted SAM-dependent methyltransferase